ncbi:restriction endonuclease subunit S [Rhizobium sp. RHZ02]|uniref:restriction endonuclease subunit S n=1 Tax=Rhizobium sp. RHZ02 TaxID=2769306 RepID=UPI00178395E0|nr:restriction endonuclease subunit S [Rhizobium sp. RHZ02]MBD9454054.1 restriction endonuclease subunit S [Rhizobium sp. RHZ02]
MNLAIYPEQDEAGIEWLGRLPRHWSVQRLKHVCSVFPSNVDKKSYDGDPQVLLCNYTDVYYNDRITPHLPFMSATATSEQIEKFSLRAGDVIITKDSESADDIAIPAYVPQDLPGVICGYHLSMLRPLQGTCGAFVKWLFDSQFVKANVAVRANGLTRVGLGQYALDNLEIPFPPLAEQTEIAAFLDRETAKIDALVEEQKQLIELLQERRAALISAAVTGKIDVRGLVDREAAE